VCDGQRHPGIWNGLQNQLYLGREDFMARMQARLPAIESLDEIPGAAHPGRKALQAPAEAYGDK
jgi:hypothetical protein